MLHLRNEYPRPHFRRDNWLSLNGTWEFEFDDNHDGEMRGIHNGKIKLEKEINKAPVSTCHSEELQVLCEPRGSTMITGTHTHSTSFKISSFFTYPITHLQVC